MEGKMVGGEREREIARDEEEGGDSKGGGKRGDRENKRE